MDGREYLLYEANINSRIRILLVVLEIRNVIKTVALIAKRASCTFLFLRLEEASVTCCFSSKNTLKLTASEWLYHITT